MWRKTNARMKLVLLLLLAMTAGGGLVAQEGQQTQETKDTTAPIKNLQFQAAEVRSVLTFLADYGGVNVVVAPKVSGVVSIKLADVTWREALDIVGRTYDLAIVDEPGYIRVLAAEDYRMEVTDKRKHNQEQLKLEGLETQIIKIDNSTSDDIVKAVKSLLSERGEAYSDSRSNSIILQEVPSNIETVLGYIKQLDSPARQIKISAQLIEVSSNYLQELGVNWLLSGTNTTESGRTATQTGEVKANLGTDAIGKYSISAIQKGWSVTAFIEALVSEGKGKIIAHPEITTVENKEARVQMGSKVPIKQFDQAGNVTITFEEVGTILRVTPHITAENQILMHLRPEQSSFRFDPNGVVINTNNAETNIIVGNGETAVIAGLTFQKEDESEVGVPILKDIPLIGRLFKFTQTIVESRDLIIFVTPTIIGSDLAMTNESDDGI